MAKTATRCHLLVEPYCILCRQDVKLIRAADVLRGAKPPEAWEQDVLCFFSIPASGHQPRRNHMFRFKTEIEGRLFINPNYNRTFSDLLRTRNTILCYGCGGCRLEDTANLMHIPCHQLAISRWGKTPIQVFCDLAWLLRPMVSWRVARRFMHEDRLSQLPTCGISSATEAGSVVSMVLKTLPVELQWIVCSMIPRGPFHSLAFALKTVAWAEKQGLSTEHTPVQRTLSTDAPFDSDSLSNNLKFDRNDVLGQTCLSMLLPEDSDAADEHIQLSDQPLEGLQYQLGTYGVLAMRVHYQDGSTSPWLGADRPKWTSFIRLRSIRELRVQSDGHKILSLGVGVEQTHLSPAASETSMPPTQNRMRIIWDHDMGSFSGLKCSLIDVSTSNYGVRGNPSSRFAQCLPLPMGNSEANALTLFCNSIGVSCIQLNGDNSLKLGSPTKSCVPITFYLYPFEEVDSVYLVTRRSRETMFCQGPYLLVRTCLNRCLYYGPFIMPSWHPTAGYVSTLGYSKTHQATSIFIDPGTPNTEHKTCIGVVQEPRKQPMTSPPPLTLPTVPSLEDGSLSSRNWEQTFLSKAAFCGAITMKVQREGHQCTGIMATFQDGRVGTLGRWDPAKPEVTSTVSQSGPLRSITFVYSEGPAHERFVRDILVNSDETIERSFTWDPVNKELAWYFTKSYDMLQYWHGTDVDLTATDDPLPYMEVE